MTSHQWDVLIHTVKYVFQCHVSVHAEAICHSPDTIRAESAFSGYIRDLEMYLCQFVTQQSVAYCHLARCSPHIRRQLSDDAHCMRQLGFACAEFAVHYIIESVNSSVQTCRGKGPSVIDCDVIPPTPRKV